MERAADDRDHDRGLAFDLATLSRRRTLALLGGGALALLVGCGSDDGDGAAASSTTSTTGESPTPTGRAEACSTTPEETAGPFPGDGSNGADVLSADGIVRSDIRSTFGSSSATAEGVPLEIRLQLADSSGSCAALAGAAVYVWHCDREARYSLYSDGAEDENFLRGVQAAGSDGRVEFASIFPAAYQGRWPHIHFEVYESVDAATGGGRPLATSQVALPEDACTAVYATAGYEQSIRNLSQTSLQRDMVFGDDGGASQLGTTTGSVDEGYTVELRVGVDTS